MIKEAFNKICDNAKVAKSVYVSLYVNVPYYGGPEEGGWWGKDTNLVAYKEYSNLDSAKAALDAVNKYAAELNEQAKIDFGSQCKKECDWLDQRGLDSDYLPEVDGEESYFVVIENTPGGECDKGIRHYE